MTTSSGRMMAQRIDPRRNKCRVRRFSLASADAGAAATARFRGVSATAMGLGARARAVCLARVCCLTSEMDRKDLLCVLDEPETQNPESASQRRGDADGDAAQKEGRRGSRALPSEQAIGPKGSRGGRRGAGSREVVEGSRRGVGAMTTGAVVGFVV